MEDLTNARKTTTNISVVVPVFNSQLILPQLAEQLGDVLIKIDGNFEVVMVNDGSNDQSWEIISELSKTRSWIKGINLSRNFGQHNALLCGIRAAKGDIIATLDDDLQHPPKEIPKLLRKLSDGFDVVYGAPQKEQHGFLRNIASQITKMVLQGAMGVDIARNVSAFRAFRSHLRGAFNNYQGSFVSIDVLLTWGTKNFAVVPVIHNSRRAGRSNYTFRMLISHAFNMITGFSVLPLQFASLIGFVFTLFGLVVLMYVLTTYFVVGGRVQGFPFISSIIAIFSGAQLFALGIIGEYLARMHFRIMEKPPYVIRSHT